MEDETEDCIYSTEIVYNPNDHYYFLRCRRCGLEVKLCADYPLEAKCLCSQKQDEARDSWAA